MATVREGLTMKKTNVALAMALLAVAPGVQARPNRAAVGALVGAGAGLVLANNMHGVHREWAVPALALAGGWLGYEWDRQNRWYDDYGPAYGPACYYYHPVVPAVAQPAPAPPAAADPHPGVDLIKVSILNSNGVRTDVNILRLGQTFVGPRGEKYEALPTSEELAKKYGM